MEYGPWLKTACQSLMLNNNGSLVNFTILHSNYLVLVAERHKVNGVSIVFTAGLVLHATTKLVVSALSYVLSLLLLLRLRLRHRDRLNGGINPRHHQMAPISLSPR